MDVVGSTKNDLARQRFLKLGVNIRKFWSNLDLDVEYKLKFAITVHYSYCYKVNIKSN